jgi:hypothetical protein
MATCPACARRVVTGQRYCLECGQRLAEPLVPWRSVAPLPPGPPLPEPARRRVPRRQTAAALLLAALGTGTILGSAAAPAPSAAGQTPVYAYVPPAAAPTATPTPTPAATPDASALPDDTPAEPAPPAPAQTPAPAPAPTPHTTSTTTPSADEPPAAPAEPQPPAAKHVVIVSLTGHHYSPVFGADAPAGYLRDDLAPQGTLLTRYHGVAGDAAANALALMAGVTELKDDSPSLPFALGTVGLTWKAYVQGAPAPCTPGPRDPFPILPMLPDCDTSDVSLDALETDLADADTAPSLAYVIPDPCHDGSYTACPDTDGLARTDAWLREWIPKVLGSEAFADDGMLVVLFDGDRPDADPERAIHVGAVIVSRFARKGAESRKSYDHLSLLRTLAGTFGVDPPGDAAGDDVKPLGRDVFR